ncbi:hypothetical protein DSOL_3889 [Desulfosporosinus metallidurans]|uniref:Uncharacterized protein n=1 Tax=Desulfosporosinus metallidurans TaxID=1888891 RepID=A0A1Q8QNE7_9FIRM|nr:hypothetical protein DSOL_3889 [Desulfosporosinus metallidurans]
MFEFKTIEIDTIKIYYSPRIKIDDGPAGISIKLRRLFIFKWLELEGAKL